MWIFFILFLFPFAKAKTSCTLKTESNIDITWNEFTPYELGSFVKTVEEGAILPGIITESAKFKNIQSGVECSFFTISQANDTYISFVATNGFEDWDLTIAKPKCEFALVFDISMCDNTNQSLLNFAYTIIDVNLVAPKFDKDTYDVEVAFPIAPEVSINGLTGLSISSTDTDFSADVTYTIEGGSEDFTLTSLPKSGSSFPVQVNTKRLVNLQKPLILTILANDNGATATLPTTKTQLTITPDSKNSVPPTPETIEPLYSAEDVKLEELKVGYTLPIDIKLKEELDGIILNMSPDDTFKATQEGKKIIVTVIKDVEPNGRDSINAVLTASITYDSLTSQSSTVIIIEFSEEDNSSPSTSTTTPTTTTSTTTDGTDPTGGDDDPDTGLMAATIIFAITTAILLGIVGFGYFKYVHRKSKIVPTSHGLRKVEEPEKNRTEGVSLEIKNENNHVRKVSRKRSLAFIEDDGATIAHRESLSGVEVLPQDDTSPQDDGLAQDESLTQDPGLVPDGSITQDQGLVPDGSVSQDGGLAQDGGSAQD